MARVDALLPTWLKVLFSVWVVGWAPVYFVEYGPQNYLWICNAANFLLLIALWREDRILFSSQAVATVLVGALWSFDLLVALGSGGVHPLGATEYMRDPAIALPTRLLSLFHLHLPVIALFGIRRLGYDRRGLPLQILITAVLLPLSLLISTSDENINWVYGPFGATQHLVHPWVYLIVLIPAYAAVLYLPTHVLIKRFSERFGR